MVELERAMKRLKSKAVGQDRVHNDMLKNLSPKNRVHLLHLFNSLYANAFVPDSWKIAIIIPLLKPGKPANEASSYLPISLTSCIGKLFERLVTNRLSWFVESRSIVGSEQAGFRTHRSTIDHVIKLDHDIKECFVNKKSTVAVFLDINKAYDTVWVNGLLFKFAKIGIHGNCLGWLANFLQNRSVCVRLGSYTSETRKINNGVPQGAPR
jgi:hypothetical protein